jgi:hypothetical protein
MPEKLTEDKKAGDLSIGRASEKICFATAKTPHIPIIL